MNESMGSEPVSMNLNELLKYQSGAVVSKVLLKKSSGNITLFAFDKGEGLSEHTAPFDAFVHITDGEADITISGKQHILRGGEAIVMPAGQPHSLKAVAAFKMILVMIKSA